MDKKLDKQILRPDFWTFDYLEAIESGWVNTRRLEGLFWQASIKYDKFESLIAKYPDSAERAIRFNRLFKQPLLWEKIRPVCEVHLGRFVQDCDLVASLRQQAEERIAKHKGLLERVSAETLVIHFAYWLEMKYFEEPDEFTFLNDLIGYRNVLQECLQRLSNGCVRTQYEIEGEVEKSWSRIRNRRQLESETTRLFEAVHQWIMADFAEEMFCSQGWKVACADNVVMAVPATTEQWEVMNLAKKNGYVSDHVELEEPLSPDDHAYLKKVSDEAANPVSAEGWWHLHTGERFLIRSLGDDVLGKVKGQFGFEPDYLLQALLPAVGGYMVNFGVPRLRAKQAGKSFLSSVLPEEQFSPEELRTFHAKGQLGNKWRQPFEAREFSVFVYETKKFLKSSVPDEETQAVFDAVTADIHDRNAMDVAKGKNFLLLKNQNCHLFLPRFFVSDKYVIYMLYNMIFEKNAKEVASHFECRVEELFELVKFHVARNYKFINDGKTDGEVDVFAFRDNTLFIVEAKMVQPRLLVHNIRSIPDTFQKAGDQLDAALENLPAHWPTISRELNISVPFESIRKVTLIVSNSCEYDHQYFNGHLKISWHELEAVLASMTSSAIYSLRHWAQSTPIQEMPEPTPTMLEQYRLFPDGDPSVDQMLACIEQSRYWELVLGEQIRPTRFSQLSPVVYREEPQVSRLRFQTVLKHPSG